MRNFILSIALCLITISGITQDYSCTFEYKHLTGTLEDKGGVVIDLMVTGNSILGSITYPGIIDKTGIAAGYQLSGSLKGSLDEHNVAVISEYEENTIVGEFSGKFQDPFTGTFRDSRNGNSFSFKLTESYPEGSIQLKSLCLNRDSVLLDTIEAPFAHIVLNLILPEKGTGYDNTRDIIIKNFFGSEMPDELSDAALLEEYSKQYFESYISANREIYDGGHSFSWEKTVTSMVSLNTKDFLSYRIDSYGYSGGAHGMGISRFLVFELGNDKQLLPEDIFIEGYEKEMSKLLERQFRIRYFVGPEQSLTEAGLFENTIYPSQNIYLNEQGIGFYYNPYKLAPYSMGAIYIFLTYDLLEPLLKFDTKVWDLF
jgi:hypothetical protein